MTVLDPVVFDSGVFDVPASGGISGSGSSLLGTLTGSGAGVVSGVGSQTSTQIAGPAVGSSDPTYRATGKRACLTAGGRILATHGKHTDGVQIRWRDPGGAWSTVTRGSVLDGRVLSGQGTGDIVAAIATAVDSGGNEIALVLMAGFWSGDTRGLQARRLTDLDNPAGPSTGALVTLEAGGANLGSSKVDIGKERTAGGVERLCVTYLKKTAVTPTYDVRYGWVTDLTTDVVAFGASGNLVTASASGAWQLNIIEKPAEAHNGLGIISRSSLTGSNAGRLLQRSSADALSTFTQGTGIGSTTNSASYPNGVRLGTEWLTAQMTDVTTGVCIVERFADAGSSRVLDMTTAAGYWDPLVTTDGTKAYLFMRKGAATTSNGGGSDDVIVKYEYTPGVGWGPESTVMAAGLGGTFGVGGYTEPNGVRNTNGGSIKWALFVPTVGDSVEQSAVYAVVAETTGGVYGSGSALLGVMSSTAAGEVEVSGSGTSSLGALSSTAAGKVEIAGSGSGMLGALASTGAGQVAVSGSGSSTLGVVTGTGTGAVGSAPISGSGSAVLGTLSSAGAGKVEVRGTGSGVLGVLTATGAGKAEVRGSGAGALGGLASSGAGRVEIKGAGSALLGSMASASTGQVAASGSGASLLGTLSSTSTGQVAVRGSGTGTLAIVSGTGTAAIGSVPVSGSGTSTLAVLTSSGTAKVEVRGTGSAPFATLTGSGAARAEVRCTGAAGLGALTATSTGRVAVSGFGSSVFATLTGTGSVTVSATVSVAGLRVLVGGTWQAKPVLVLGADGQWAQKQIVAL